MSASLPTSSVPSSSPAPTVSAEACVANRRMSSGRMPASAKNSSSQWSQTSGGGVRVGARKERDAELIGPLHACQPRRPIALQCFVSNRMEWLRAAREPLRLSSAQDRAANSPEGRVGSHTDRRKKLEEVVVCSKGRVRQEVS